MRKSILEASLLLVDDDPTIIQLLSRILSNYSSVRFATTGADALRLAREDPPDLILLDAQMGDMSGLQVCEALKADEALAGVPVIFVSSHQEAELEVAVLKMGAVDFIRKPFNASQVTARVNTQLQLKRLADDLRKQSRVDGETGLGNQAACDQMLLRELARAHEAGQSLCFALVDIDFSKSYESLYGPNLAQASIAAVAETLRRNARRAGDYVARLARDKFALILPDTDAEGGLHVVHRVLDAVEALDISHQGSSVSRHLTCSAGVACLAAEAAGAADASGLLSRAAADALSQAKSGGRAQAVLASPEAPAADLLPLP